MIVSKLKLNQSGSSLIVTLLVILFLTSIIVSSISSSVISNQQIVANSLRAEQAFDAAEAGIDFGIKFFNKNQASILVDSNDSGYFDDYQTDEMNDVILNNNTKFSISFLNPIQNNFSIIELTAVGRSSDATVSRTVKQSIYRHTFLKANPPASISSKGSVSLGGNVSISNSHTAVNIISGSSVNLSGAADTNDGTNTISNKRALGSDVIQNDVSYAMMSEADYFKHFFTSDKAISKGLSDISYTNKTDTNYSDLLNGVKGKVIWIEQTSGTARLAGNATIGTIDEPVILIIDGNFKASGTTTIYGTVYITQSWSNSGGGNLSIEGSIIVAGDLSSTGTPNVNYNTQVNSNLKNMATYSKIPGTWVDF